MVKRERVRRMRVSSASSVRSESTVTQWGEERRERERERERGREEREAGRATVSEFGVKRRRSGG